MRPISRRTRAHEPEAGLTLAEMLLVLAILALAAGLVASRGLPGRGPLRLAALESFLRDARSAAMVQGRTIRLQVADGRRIEGAGAGFDLGQGFLVQIGSTDGGLAFLADGSSPGGTVQVLAPDGDSYGANVAAVTGTVTPLQP